MSLIPQRLKRIVAVILIVGFGSSIAIYVRAISGPVGYTGSDLEDSKQYLHDMELYGGKVNVLAGDFREWFASLWHGRNLAYTVAFLTVVLAVGVVFFGTPLPQEK